MRAMYKCHTLTKKTCNYTKKLHQNHISSLKSLNFQQIEDCIIGNEIQVNFPVVQELPASPNAHQCTFVLLLPRKPAILTRKMGYQPALNQTSSLANAKYI